MTVGEFAVVGGYVLAHAMLSRAVAYENAGGVLVARQRSFG